MCLAVPARVVEIDGTDAVVEIEGVRRKTNVSLIENPKIGDCVLLHAGFAINKWSATEVREYNEIVGEILSVDHEARERRDEQTYAG